MCISRIKLIVQNRLGKAEGLMDIGPPIAGVLTFGNTKN